MSWNVKAFLFALFNKPASRSNKYSDTDRFWDLKWLQDWDLIHQTLLPSRSTARGVLGLIFAGYVPLASQSPYPIIVYPVANYRPVLITFGQMCNFRDPNLVFFYFCIYLILNEEHFTFHLLYKHSGTFANRKYEELSYPKNQKLCDPILATPLKMRPRYSQSSRENATPSSGTSPLASYKEVLPPRGNDVRCVWATCSSSVPLLFVL